MKERPPTEPRGSAAPGAALGIALAIAIGCGASPGGGKTAPPPPARGVVSSNVLREDYAGSAACETCHADVYERWAASPMRRMTRPALGSEIRAPFDGSRVRFKEDAARMETHAGRRYMRVLPRFGPERLFLVTKVIGGRYREDYAGIEVPAPGALSAAAEASAEQQVLPFSYLLFSGDWRYKGYSVLVPERERLAPGMTWQKTCVFCHNTVPHLATLYDDLSEKPEVYQGRVTNYLLPEERRGRFEVKDEEGLVRALAAEISVLGGPPPEDDLEEALGAATRSTRRRFGEGHLVELGIGCEACHHGAREHTRDPSKKPSFEVESPLFRFVPPEGANTRAAAINRTCMQCHTVLFSAYPYAWEGASRSDGTGGSQINSGEARDFALGGCSTQMSCANCHDPHAEDDPKKLAELGTPAGNGVCTRCHEAYEGESALARHTHHAPGGEGSACLACHMPRKNMGLGYELTRYHRIGSPNDRERAARDRPLECALCHADKSVAELTGAMTRFWGKSIDPRALRLLYGDLSARVLPATLERGKPHEQVVALATLGERGEPGDAPRVAAALAHPYPLARRYARRALETLTGRPIEVDLDASSEAIAEAARRHLASPSP